VERISANHAKYAAVAAFLKPLRGGGSGRSEKTGMAIRSSSTAYHGTKQQNVKSAHPFQRNLSICGYLCPPIKRICR